MLELGLKLVLAYLLGSLSGALLVGRLYGGVDIRREGSGNAGGTNALRTHGWRFALWVVLIDVGKGALAATAVAALALPGGHPGLPGAWVPPLCGAAAVLGHVYPFWYELRGGKGASTLIGVLGVLSPDVLIPVILVWVLVLALTGYVGLATILAGATAPVYVGLRVGLGNLPLLAFTLSMALFLVYTHRTNIERMLSGHEDRKHRFMLRGRSRRGARP